MPSAPSAGLPFENWRTQVRREFPAKVKREALDRAKGICEGCGAPLTIGKYEFDHDLADGLGGEPTLENCKLLCLPCHAEKTGKRDVPLIARVKRIRDRHLGIRKKSRFACSRDGAFRKKINGQVERR